MPDRYWVGGTATWDATAGTKWAATSGGAGGASVPTGADDVYFDGNSGASTITIGGTGVLCRGFNSTGFTGTITGSQTLNILGSLVISSGTTWTHTGSVSFQPTSGAFTVTTSGKTLGAVTFGTNGGTGSWTLQDALSSSGAITVTSGTFTTNNFNVTASQLLSNNSNTRTINLGSSTLTFSASTPVNFATNTNLTFNAGTSIIICSSASAILAGGANTPGQGVAFYNVSFTSTTAGTHTIQARNSFNSLSVAAPSSAGVTQITFDSPTTISGTLSTTGTAGNRRVWFRGVTYGIAQTLTINSAPSLTDADFRDIYVVGTAAPVSGTRIGDLRGNRGITFSTPKTVYWNLAGAQNWSANAWATTPAGTPSTDNFPLAQDTAAFTDSGSVTGSIALDAAVPYTGTIDMSARTSAMTLVPAQTFTVYGDWQNGSGTTISGGTLTTTFSGRNTQTITSAGKTFSQPLTIDSYGGTVQLADALNIGAQTLTVTNGTFNTQGYAVTAGALSSSNSNVRAINLGASTLTFSSSSFFSLGGSNLTFNAGTSTITYTGTTAGTITSPGLSFFNVSFTGTTAVTHAINGINTFNNLTFTAPASAGLMQCTFSANQAINGTLTVAGATPVRRIFVRSDTLGTTRTLTVNSLSATDCDFRDITIAGAAAGSSPTRAGDCGGNTGITFPAPKTVYWNLAGTQNWSATAWATSSGGTPAINNFPLAQDTAVFDNTGSVTGTISIDASWNIGTLDASARTSAMTLSAVGSNPYVYADWKFGTGVTMSSTTGTIFFGARGTQTITNNGVSFGCNVTIDCATGTVQLADALTLGSARTLTLTSGTFNAVTYNVTTGLFAGTAGTLRMGSGTWTLSGVGTVWNYTAGTFFKGTANIVLSDTSTSARLFNGGSLSYNKLTIGGSTGTSTFTIQNNNQFTELASTKTVAHTIALGTTSQTIGAWTVSGTAGNVVTVSGTGTITIAGARVSGVDYLALGTTTISATSPGEFYAGANSTGGTNAILTAAPAPVTRYWRGGTGTWDATTTTNWSATSGGAGGASVPTSADAVIFDSASNATAYTVTCTATQLRCASLTMAGPASGNVTWAGTAPLAIHGNVTLPATGMTRNYTGAITLTGSSTGRTFTTNGVALASAIEVNGVGCGWTLGSSIDTGGFGISCTNGSLDSSTYNITASTLQSSNGNSRTVKFGSSTVTLTASTPINFATNTNLIFDAGTSSISCSSGSATLSGGGQTFNNVSFTSTAAASRTINGANTFNNLSVAGRVSAGLSVVQLSANQTINGTLTLSAGTNAPCRTFVQSDTIGTPRTLTCAAVASLTDIDFRDITIAGAAAPVSGIRLGDCKGNSGITFPAGKTVYYRVAAGGNWGNEVGSGSWSATSGGALDITQFPLAQDTAAFPSATYPSSGGTVSFNANYNVGTIDMSARTSNTMTLATGTQTPTIYGNWINGTGTTISGSGRLFFSGRSSQTITSAGRTFTQSFTIDSPGGSVTLQDAYTMNLITSSFAITSGTFDANGYSFTLSGASSAVSSSNTNIRTIAIGSGTWTIAGSGIAWQASTATNLTVTGTGTVSLTSASAKTFAGGGLSYSGVTLDQGGAGVLNLAGNNTFKTITNTYSATGATSINLGTTTQTLTQPWTATGAAGRVLTVTGTSASAPATLIYTGSGNASNVDYLAVTGVRSYDLVNKWYAGPNSTNNGSLGWIFSAAPSAVTYQGNFFAFF